MVFSFLADQWCVYTISSFDQSQKSKLVEKVLHCLSRDDVRIKSQSKFCDCHESFSRKTYYFGHSVEPWIYWGWGHVGDGNSFNFNLPEAATWDGGLSELCSDTDRFCCFGFAGIHVWDSEQVAGYLQQVVLWSILGTEWWVDHSAGRYYYNSEVACYM